SLSRLRSARGVGSGRGNGRSTSTAAVAQSRVQSSLALYPSPTSGRVAERKRGRMGSSAPIVRRRQEPHPSPPRRRGGRKYSASTNLFLVTVAQGRAPE